MQKRVIYYSVFIVLLIVLTIPVLSYGDTIDILYWMFLIVCSFFILYKFQTIGVIGCVIVGMLMYIFSLDKLSGYPDKEILSTEMGLVVFILNGIFIVFLLKKKIPVVLFALIFFLLNTSFVRILPETVRQVWFAHQIERVDSYQQKTIAGDIGFITKVYNQQVFTISKDMQYVQVFVYSSERSQYVFEAKNILLDGSGSMDAQVPNYSFLLKKWIMICFDYAFLLSYLPIDLL